MPTFDYTVDDEAQSTTEKVLTPTEVLSKAEIDASKHYLVELEGNRRVSYQGKPNEQIHMHEHMKFVSVSTGPTPVS